MFNKLGNKENKQTLKTDESSTEEPPHLTKMKSDHLEQLIFNIKLFTENQNMEQFKKFLTLNYKKFSDLQNQIEALEQELPQLHSQEQQYENQATQSQEKELQLLQQNLEALHNEELQYQQQIKQKQQQLQSVMFYREYQFMLQEKQGLINSKLKTN